MVGQFTQKTPRMLARHQQYHYMFFSRECLYIYLPAVTTAARVVAVVIVGMSEALEMPIVFPQDAVILVV